MTVLEGVFFWVGIAAVTGCLLLLLFVFTCEFSDNYRRRHR